MNIKHTLLMGLLGVFLMACGQDQGRGFGGRGNFDPQEMIDRQVNMMQENLDLTEEQLVKVKEILTENSDKMMGLRDEYGDDREGMRSAMREINESRDTKLKEVLTEEQWTKYEEVREKMRGRRGGGPRGGGEN